MNTIMQQILTKHYKLMFMWHDGPVELFCVVYVKKLQKLILYINIESLIYINVNFSLVRLLQA